jgi:hypothetical protein
MPWGVPIKVNYEIGKGAYVTTQTLFCQQQVPVKAMA